MALPAEVAGYSSTAAPTQATVNALNDYITGIYIAEEDATITGVNGYVDLTTSSGSSVVFGTAPPNGVIIDVIGYYITSTTTVNTSAPYTWSGVHTFNANVSLGASVLANNAMGSNEIGRAHV